MAQPARTARKLDRRHHERPMGPFETVRGFDSARRGLGKLKDKIVILKYEAGIKSLSDQSISAKHKAYLKSKDKRVRYIRQIKAIKPTYISVVKNAVIHNRLLKLGIIRDPKFTEIENARAFTQRVFDTLRKCRANGKPCSMAIIDIDNFKTINSNFGHTVGDVVIHRLVKELIKTAKRNGWATARTGGEEFKIFAPVAPEVLAFEIEKLKAEFTKSLISTHDMHVHPTSSWNSWVPPTCSAGISSIRKVGDKVLLSKLVSRMAQRSERALLDFAKVKKDSVEIFNSRKVPRNTAPGVYYS